MYEQQYSGMVLHGYLYVSSAAEFNTVSINVGSIKAKKKWQSKSTKFDPVSSIGEAPAYKNSNILTVLIVTKWRPISKMPEGV